MTTGTPDFLSKLIQLRTLAQGRRAAWQQRQPVKRYHLPGQHDQQSHGGDGGGEYNRAGEVVSGMRVRPFVPNQDSIAASLTDYEILPGIREVPLALFDPGYKPVHDARTVALAEHIKESGEINPLIVAVDGKGPYIIEGGHRFDAMYLLGVRSFPAMVVIDKEAEAPKFKYARKSAYHLPGQHDQQRHAGDDGGKDGNSSLRQKIEGRIIGYHGTRADFIEFENISGDMGIHFGSDKFQARQRLSDTKFIGAVKGEGRILEKELLISNPLDLGDAGDWTNPISVAKQLLKKQVLSKQEFGAIQKRKDTIYRQIDLRYKIVKEDYVYPHNIGDFKSEADRIRYRQELDSFFASEIAKLRGAVRTKGYDGIKYKNTTEGMKSGDSSYIVFDKSQIRDVASFGSFSLPKTKKFAYALSTPANAYRLALMGFDFEPGQLPTMREKFKAYLEEHGYHLPGQHEQQSHAGDDGSISNDEHEALDDYRDVGIDLNMALRAGKSTGILKSSVVGARTNVDTAQMVERLDSLIAKSHLRNDVTLYRGMALNDLEAAERLNPGVVIRDKGYASFSSSLSVADEFLTDKDKVPVLIEFRAKRGDTAYRIPVTEGFDNEDEVIYPRNAGFRVVSSARMVRRIGKVHYGIRRVVVEKI